MCRCSLNPGLNLPHSIDCLTSNSSLDYDLKNEQIIFINQLYFTSILK